MLRFGMRGAMRAAMKSPAPFIASNQLPRHLSRSVMPIGTSSIFGELASTGEGFTSVVAEADEVGSGIEGMMLVPRNLSFMSMQTLVEYCHLDLA
eukprot:TRINITY_DN6001_c1_g1_i1.p1 TRINITY_DN6001_c1_g1~~TRINITY_DN6001_c1_g1_i1.p1  ORF type:complete len:109 (+),score=17.13 TRINITY_DN6001_c1_g1_i1:43-327(+)